MKPVNTRPKLDYLQDIHFPFFLGFIFIFLFLTLASSKSVMRKTLFTLRCDHVVCTCFCSCSTAMCICIVGKRKKRMYKVMTTPLLAGTRSGLKGVLRSKTHLHNA